MSPVPLWLRLAEYAIEHEIGGAVLLEVGELRRALNVGSPSEVGRAIRRAVETGWLAPRSNSRVLLVPGPKRRMRSGAR